MVPAPAQGALADAQARLEEGVAVLRQDLGPPGLEYALNFLALDDVSVSEEGELIDERSIIALPMKGKIESLNSAVAGSVALYTALGAREGKA